MLKHLKFSGIFHDDNLSVNVTLENPADYGFAATDLLFSIMVSVKSNIGIIPRPEDFTFYVMDETNCMHNTQIILTSAGVTLTENAEPEKQPNWLILADFKSDFLYQDLRIAFYYQLYQRINIIELRH